jgi:hypothetical protein
MKKNADSIGSDEKLSLIDGLSADMIRDMMLDSAYILTTANGSASPAMPNRG